MKQKILILFINVFLVLMIGCDRNPLKKTSILAEEGLLPGINSTFIVYDDVLKTGGNLFTYPGGENQVVDLESRNAPFSGKKCIRYSWTGGDVQDANLGIQRHDFVGLDLPVSQGSEDFDAAQSVDLSAGGYTKISFWIKGSLSTNTTLKIEAVDDGSTSTSAPVLTLSSISSTWEKKEIAITPSHLLSVKEFFKITFIYTQPTGTTTPGNGGIVYIDDIILEQ